MKKKFLILIIGLFIFSSTSYAASCRDAYNASIAAVDAQFDLEMLNCSELDINCQNIAQSNHTSGEIVAGGLFALCCYVFTGNCL